MLEPWTVLIAVHAAAAALALVLGPVQLIRPKGDAVHRILGRVWAGLMLVVAASSFGFGGWNAPINIFLRVLATWTLVTVTVAVVLVKRGHIGPHRRLMTGNYVGLVAAFVGVVVVPDRLVPSWFVAHPVTMSIIAVIIIAVVGALVGGTLTLTRRQPRPV